MPFIEINEMDEVEELQTAPEGVYDLIISSVDEKEDKNGNPYYRFSLEFADHSEYYGLSHFMFLPKDSDEPKRREGTIRSIKRFLTMCGVRSTGGFDPSELLGATITNARVSLTEPNDDGQVFNKLILDKFA